MQNSNPLICLSFNQFEELIAWNVLNHFDDVSEFLAFKMYLHYASTLVQSEMVRPCKLTPLHIDLFFYIFSDVWTRVNANFCQRNLIEIFQSTKSGYYVLELNSSIW